MNLTVDEASSYSRVAPRWSFIALDTNFERFVVYRPLVLSRLMIHLESPPYPSHKILYASPAVYSSPPTPVCLETAKTPSFPLNSHVFCLCFVYRFPCSPCGRGAHHRRTHPRRRRRLLQRRRKASIPSSWKHATSGTPRCTAAPTPLSRRCSVHVKSRQGRREKIIA